MNNYPTWWNTTITVYNKFVDPQTKVVRWDKTVITGAFWKYIHEKVMIGQTVLETNSIVCRIRKDDRFLEKYEWLQKPNDEINEYQQGKRSTDLIAKYKELQGCMSIDECANNTGGGRGQEHYVAKGI